MTDAPLQTFDDALAELDAAGLRRQRRVVEAIDGPAVEAGRRC